MLKKILIPTLLSIFFIVGVAVPKAYAYFPTDPGPLDEAYYYTDVDDSYESTTQIQNSLSSVGYDAHTYGNVSNAYYVRNTMCNDAMFYIDTHGYDGGGRIACFDSNNNQITQLSANQIDVSSNYSLGGIYSGSTALSSIRLAYYSACQTGRTNSSWGNLPKKTTSLGALVSIGFYNDILTDQSIVFDEQFYTNLENGQIVSTALSNALYTVSHEFGGNTGSVDSYIIYHRGGSQVYYESTKITPANYGN